MHHCFFVCFFYTATIKNSLFSPLNTLCNILDITAYVSAGVVEFTPEPYHCTLHDA